MKLFIFSPSTIILLKTHHNELKKLYDHQSTLGLKAPHGQKINPNKIILFAAYYKSTTKTKLTVSTLLSLPLCPKPYFITHSRQKLSAGPGKFLIPLWLHI